METKYLDMKIMLNRLTIKRPFFVIFSHIFVVFLQINSKSYGKLLKTLNIKQNRAAESVSTTTSGISMNEISTADRGRDERLYLHYYYAVNNPKDFVKIVDLS